MDYRLRESEKELEEERVYHQHHIDTIIHIIPTNRLIHPI